MLRPKVVTTFNRPVLFKCLDNCGLCCSYRVHLLAGDVEKIKNCLPLDAIFSEDGHLSKHDGYCCFLDKDNRCTIYDNRPSYCRAFPFYTEAGSEIDIDLSCPGVGHGDVINEQSLRKLCADAAARIDPYSCPDSVPLSEKLVVGQPGYISHDDFKQTGLMWCDEVCEVKSGTEIIDLATALSRQKSPLSYEATELLTDFFDIVKGVNIHITADKNLIRYTFEVKNGFFSVNGQKYFFNGGENSSKDYLNRMSQEELDTVREYLQVWFRRRIFYRFCLVNSLRAPMLYSPASVAFAFVANLIKKVWLITNLLRLYWAEYEDVVDKTEPVKEAVRVFDGRLRTKCRAVGIQT